MPFDASATASGGHGFSRAASNLKIAALAAEHKNAIVSTQIHVGARFSAIQPIAPYKAGASVRRRSKSPDL